jgi:hypothetical protein
MTADNNSRWLQLERLQRKNKTLRRLLTPSTNIFKRRISFGQTIVEERPDLGDPLDVYFVKLKSEIRKATSSFTYFKQVTRC